MITKNWTVLSNLIDVTEYIIVTEEKNFSNYNFLKKFWKHKCPITSMVKKMGISDYSPHEIIAPITVYLARLGGYLLFNH